MVDQAEIHRKAVSGDVEERRAAVEQLGCDFADLPDKSEAWDDLHRLTGDVDLIVRLRAADTLGTAFQHVPDKDVAWEDLIRLTGDVGIFVWGHVADALGTAFQHVPDKDVAWDDLHRLTGDEYSSVRSRVADALGTAFQHVPDKDVAWEDLIRLTGDENIDVRAYANHSLGRVSIFKATEAESEEGFRKEMKNALEFFERSSKEVILFNPSSFCLPFYRSFYTVTFEKEGAEDEVRRYLAVAKSASEGSKNKEILIEAVENLTNALTEAHKATDFGAMKSDLNACRRYCDRAADLIGDASEGAPGAARVLRRGLPIIGEQIKEIIREIQEKAEALCRETRGTGMPYEPLGRDINKWTRELSDRGYLRDEKDVPRIRDLLGQLCNLLHEDDQDYPCKIVEGIREGRKPEDTLSDIATALSYLVPSIRLQPQIDKTISDERPSQKTSRSTTVFAGAYSTVVVPHTETESGDVTVNTVVTEESQPDTQPDRPSKRTAIEISADIAVHVFVYTVLHHYLEDLMPVIAPILVLSALIILLLIIRNAKSR